MCIRDSYHGDNVNQIVCCSTSGIVKGFSIGQLTTHQPEKTNMPVGVSQQSELYTELVKTRNELQQEISILSEQSPKKNKGQSDVSVVPRDTSINCSFKFNLEKKCTELVFSTNNTAVIRIVAVFAEQVFQTESVVCASANPSNTLAFPLLVQKNASVDLNIKILVGNNALSQSYQVIELTRRLPKFVSFMYVPTLQNVTMPRSSLTCVIRERIPRFVKWLDQCFIIDYAQLEDWERRDSLEVSFIKLSDNTPLIISIPKNENGRITIKTDSLDIAGEIIQDICSFMSINELESTANFPFEIEELKKTIQIVNDANSARLHMTADMAESVSNIKAFMVKAEDARFLLDMKIMRKMYGSLYLSLIHI
eukprot:TRINITY_DN8747_c0_g1_i1.p1 TRINITY_DN8747_c0_g1~~TRINITY_DN8747_c0_g1_i1.p1  ORF type:complete len:390 (-),score=93.20 TRINITY_DN8747_c0_g1_i1:57-1154(-)